MPKIINSIKELIQHIQDDLKKWQAGTKPWFRGESTCEDPLCPKNFIDHLCPKIVKHEKHIEDYLLQSFRRQAGGLSNVPPREHTDRWLFLAQHYGVPTRLLDWTEGALLALYFAINKITKEKVDKKNKENHKPMVYMLNPHKLNEFAGIEEPYPYFPLTHDDAAKFHIKLAWQKREINKTKYDRNDLKKFRKKYPFLNLNLPLAFPATYHNIRMIAQRSCFTIHGTDPRTIKTILSENNITESECLFEYEIEYEKIDFLISDLSILGISAATIFPDLDHLAKDLVYDIKALYSSRPSISPYRNSDPVGST